MTKWVEGRVVGRRHWTGRLYSLQVEAPVDPFRAGQFTRIGLDLGAERVARSYSYVNAPEERPLEFYFITVPGGPLSARLAALEPGDAIWVAPKPSGMLTLAQVPEAGHLWLLSTGTAIGPFLSILKTAEPWRRFSKVMLVHAVRAAAELAYRDLIADLARARSGQFAYVPFVSREDTDFAIRGRIPDAIRDGRLEQRAGLAIGAAQSQLMVCGNPAMVEDTLAVLEARGLRRNRRKEPGQITVEAYW
jgi:ferredoxin--NADP+ reductase